MKEKTLVNLIDAILSGGLQLFNVFVATKLWTWFMVPFGLPTISYWHMFGVMITMCIVFSTIRSEAKIVDLWINKFHSEKEIRSLGMSIALFVVSAMTLFIGWVISTLM